MAIRKKRNPADSTRRNIKASQRRDTVLLARLQKLDARVKRLEAWRTKLNID